MTNSKIWLKALVFIGLMFVSGQASAGGIRLKEDTVSINGGSKRAFKPNEPVSVSFELIDYEFGANKFKSIFFAAVPAGEKQGTVKRSDLPGWRLFYARMKDAKKSRPSYLPAVRDDELLKRIESLERLERLELEGPEFRPGLPYIREELSRLRRQIDSNDSDSQGLLPIQMNFAAPSRPGRYRLMYNPIPVFTSNMLIPGGELGQVVELEGPNKILGESAILPHRTSFRSIVTFTVSDQTSVEDSLTVYLRANGKVPTSEEIRGGVTERPLEFSWYVGPEFKLEKKNVLFRYKIFPIDTDWSAWTTDTSVKYHFLPRGIWNFRVEARYDDKKTSFESQPAKFNFVLSDHLVAKATAATLFKGPIEKQMESEGKILQTKIAFETIYAASRALIIGVHAFDDKMFFREFPAEKIQRDVNTLETALVKNNFQVTKLFKERVTRDEITIALDKFVNDSNQNDRLFIYFSSHGFPDKNSPSDGYIATSDCELKSPSVRCLRLGDIELQAKRALEGRKVRQVLIAVDSCFSGLGVISKTAGVPDFSRLAVAPGSYMLTAGMADQLAQIDPELNMSTFTHFLAKGLEGEANIFDKNGIISLSELFLYVQYNVAKQTDSKQIPMLGRLRGDGEMLFRPVYTKK